MIMEGPGETTVTDTRIVWKEGKVGMGMGVPIIVADISPVYYIRTSQYEIQ